jgi:pimeloyl-ACP methyl ester carboxylesterase
MLRTPTFLIGLLFLSLAQSGHNFSTQAKSTSFSLQPCEVSGVTAGTKEKVLCGRYEVFEDRVANAGRKISLKIVVFPAPGSEKLADPFWYIPGGPGSSATEDAPYIANQFRKLRERRDIVFVDQRGTGESHPLNCEFFNINDPQSYFGYYFPLEAVRKCRAQLEPDANLKLYTTSIAMDDFEDVRAALGLDQINLIGTSYGTRAVQVYLRAHGRHVRTVVLHGVSPTNQSMPRDFPQHTERALNGVIDECSADEKCRSTFPELRADVKKVLATLIKSPVEVEVKRPQGNSKVKLSRDLAGEAVRYMLYQAGAASRIPLLIHEAANGNFGPLADAALFYRMNIVATGSNGMYLSVTCAEDLPMIKAGEVGKNVGKNGANTFLGDYRLTQQRAACELWVRGNVPSNYSEPTRSKAPALIMTGEWDPVTPPVYGDTAAKYLPNSLHVVVPHGGHGFGGLDGTQCLDDLVVKFVNAGTTSGLDTSCVRNIKRKGFVLKLPSP